MPYNFDHQRFISNIEIGDAFKEFEKINGNKDFDPYSKPFITLPRDSSDGSSIFCLASGMVLDDNPNNKSDNTPAKGIDYQYRLAIFEALNQGIESLDHVRIGAIVQNNNNGYQHLTSVIADINIDPEFYNSLKSEYAQIKALKDEVSQLRKDNSPEGMANWAEKSAQLAELEENFNNKYFSKPLQGATSAQFKHYDSMNPDGKKEDKMYYAPLEKNISDYFSKNSNLNISIAPQKCQGQIGQNCGDHCAMNLYLAGVKNVEDLSDPKNHFDPGELQQFIAAAANKNVNQNNYPNIVAKVNIVAKIKKSAKNQEINLAQDDTESQDDAILFESKQTTFAPLASVQNVFQPILTDVNNSLSDIKKFLSNENNCIKCGIQNYKVLNNSVELTLNEGKSKGYITQNEKGGISYSLQRGMSHSDYSKSMQNICKLAVENAKPNSVFDLTKTPPHQKQEVYDALVKHIAEKKPPFPENAIPKIELGKDLPKGFKLDPAHESKVNQKKESTQRPK